MGGKVCRYGERCADMGKDQYSWQHIDIKEVSLELPAIWCTDMGCEGVRIWGVKVYGYGV